ncbi:MAG: hypothetical protein M0Q15_12815 [Nevskia sp.]|nr:hypothetical protein [Nevskia sp.]
MRHSASETTFAAIHCAPTPHTINGMGRDPRALACIAAVPVHDNSYV